MGIRNQEVLGMGGLKIFSVEGEKTVGGGFNTHTPVFVGLSTWYFCFLPNFPFNSTFLKLHI